MISIHATERQEFKRCRRKWKYNYLEHLEPNSEPFGALYLGAGIHVGLAEYYLGNTPYPADAFRDWFDELPRDFKANNMEKADEMYTLGVGMLTGYVDFAKENDTWKVIAVEEPIKIRIPGTRNFLVCTLDLLVEVRGRLWVVDHKTTAAFHDPEYLEFDDQMTAYMWGVYQKYGQKPHGAIYNQLLKSLPRVPALLQSGKGLSKAAIVTTREIYYDEIIRHGFKPEDYVEILDKLSVSEGFYKREQIARNLNEMDYFTGQIAAESREMNAAKRGEMVLFPNPTRDCVWECSYKSLCRAESGQGDFESLKQTLFHVVEARPT